MDLKLRVLNLIHYVIIIFLLIVLPLLPIKILKKTYLYLIPLIISFLWLFFDGCPITNFTSKKNNASFIKDNLSKIFPNIKVRTVTHLNSFIFILILTSIIYRIL